MTTGTTDGSGGFADFAWERPNGTADRVLFVFRPVPSLTNSLSQSVWRHNEPISYTQIRVGCTLVTLLAPKTATAEVAMRRR